MSTSTAALMATKSITLLSYTIVVLLLIKYAINARKDAIQVLIS